VVTHHAATADVVAAVKAGLEEDGLGDLVREIKVRDAGTGGSHVALRLQRRPAFATAEIYLPLVLRVDGTEVRRLDYEADVLAAIDWSGLDVGPLLSAIPDNWQPVEAQMRRIRLADSDVERIVAEASGVSTEVLKFDPLYAVRTVVDLVPNPWVAREVVGNLLSGLMERGFDADEIARTGRHIIDELRRWLEQRRDELAEAKFRAAVAAGEVQFRLRVDGRNLKMPATDETAATHGARQLLGKDGGPLARSLFAPMYEIDFNTDERDVAVYLDGEQALRCWHRNVAREQYSLQAGDARRFIPTSSSPYNAGTVLRGSPCSRRRAITSPGTPTPSTSGRCLS
jgi:type III restriction enzyme